MGVTASGPPFVKPFDPLCKCGWMWSYQCERDEKCGLNQGMPEYKDIPSPKESSGNCGVGGKSVAKEYLRNEVLKDMEPIYKALGVNRSGEKNHTPYEFLEKTLFGSSVVSEDEVAQAQVDLNKVCREVVEDLVKDSKSTQVGGTHYAEMSVQPWTAMKAWMSPAEYAGYHVGTVIGYLSRHKKKGRLTDIKKAKHHLEELIRYFEEDEEYPW